MRLFTYFRNGLLILITVATIPTPIIINSIGINGSAYRSYAKYKLLKKVWNKTFIHKNEYSLHLLQQNASARIEQIMKPVLIVS